MRRPKMRSIFFAVLFLSVTTALGAVFGWVVGQTLYWGAESVAVVAIETDSSVNTRAELQFPNVLEYLRSPAFAGKVALEAGLPELAHALPSKEFGGGDALYVRQLRETDELELRIRMADPTLPQKALEAATKTLMKELEQSQVSRLQTTEVKWLQEDLEKAKNIEQAIYLRLLRDLADESEESANLRLVDYLVTQRDRRLDLYEKLLNATGRAEPSNEPTIVIEPTAAVAILDSNAKTIGLGAIGGCVIGLLTLLGCANQRHEHGIGTA